MTKKPLPWMRMSSALPWLDTAPPGAKSCETLATCTPSPTALRLPPSMEEEYSAENSARDDLKPAVPTLAMLLPATSIRLCAAFNPDTAMLNDMNTPCVVSHDTFVNALIYRRQTKAIERTYSMACICQRA